MGRHPVRVREEEEGRHLGAEGGPRGGAPFCAPRCPAVPAGPGARAPAGGSGAHAALVLLRPVPRPRQGPGDTRCGPVLTRVNPCSSLILQRYEHSVTVFSVTCPSRVYFLN